MMTMMEDDKIDIFITLQNEAISPTNKVSQMLYFKVEILTPGLLFIN